MAILKNIKMLGVVVLLAAGPQWVQKAVAQPGVSVSIQTFYNELAPYGQWVPSQYGDVWIPNAGPTFQPYASDGHWIITEFGNTWVSDYPWGWAPFHYGRWYFDNQYGWAWIPGSEWGPAWVSWRSGGGYYGWAPLGPGIDVNVNINIPALFWTFVPQIYITSPQLYSYYVPRPNVVSIYQNTTIINNIYRYDNRAYVYGPPRGDIERITRRSVPVYRIDNLDRPGRAVLGNGSVGFYRPDRTPGNGSYYGRNDRDRYDNSSRPNYGNGYPNRDYSGNRDRDYNGNRNYNGNNPSDRGGYSGNNNVPRDYNGPNYPSNRDYNGNNSVPNRDYNRSNNNPNRNDNPGNPNDSRGSYGPGSTPAPGNYPAPNRPEPSRGGYSDPRTVAPAAPSQQPSFPQRSFDRPAGQAPADNQQIPGGRQERHFQPQPMPQPQGDQPQNQRPVQGGQWPGRGESVPGSGHNQRGPR